MDGRRARPGPDRSQERVQRFLWYELPLKWMTSLDHKLAIAQALARALDLLDLPRYAAICRSPTTRAILEAYEEDDDKGLAAFQRADAASGIHPPDLPEFEWGSTMGWGEAGALSSTAGFLELAVAGGDLVPGGPGLEVPPTGAGAGAPGHAPGRACRQDAGPGDPDGAHRNVDQPSAQ